MSAHEPYHNIIGFENSNLDDEINQILDIVQHLNALIARAKKGRNVYMFSFWTRNSSAHITAAAFDVFRFKSITFLPIIDFEIRQMGFLCKFWWQNVFARDI